MILAEGALEQAELGLQGHSRPLGNLVCALLHRQVRDCEVYVFEHLAEDELTAVARAGELLGIGGTQRFVVPRHITETLYLIEIEIRAEEAGQCLILHTDCLVRAMIQVLQQGVYVSECAPAPTAAAGGNGAFAHFLV